MVILLLLSLAIYTLGQEISCRGTIIMPEGTYQENVNMTLFRVSLLSDSNYMDSINVDITQRFYLELPAINKDYIIKPAGPNGAIFEPSYYFINPSNAANKSACKALDFKFMGFQFSGKVVVKNHARGPAGIAIELTSGTDKKYSVTDVNGEFSYKGLYPGLYLIKPSSEYYNFVDEFSSITCEITWNSVESCASKNLQILGYSVTGHVGNALSKAIINIYSTTSQDHCIELKGKKEISINDKKLYLICSTSSNSKLEYIFKGLNEGSYYIVPLQEDGGQIEILPAHIEFAITNNNVILNQTFTIHLTTLNGIISNKIDPIPGALLMLQKENKIIAKCTSNDKGEFAFERLELGSYTLLISHKDYLFEPFNVDLNESTQAILIVHKKSTLSGTVPVFGRSVKAVVDIKNSVDYATIQRISTDDKGLFSIQLENGDYIVEPSIDASDGGEYELQPMSMQVSLKGPPITNLIFSQLKVNLTVEFKLLRKAEEFGVWVSCNSNKHAIRKFINSSKYEFTDLFPNEYNIIIEDNYYCWEKKSMDIKLTRKSSNSILFVHSGYSIFYKTKEDIPAKMVSDAGLGENHVLFKVSGNPVCVKSEGTFFIIPKDDFKFESQLNYTVSQKSPILNFLPSAYLSTITILADESIAIDDRKQIIIEISINKAEKQLLKYNSETNSFQYQTYIASMSTLVVTPSISDKSTSHITNALYFEPSNVETILTESANAKIKLNLIKGKVYHGQVIPPIQQVRIWLSDKKTGAPIYECFTDINGAYSTIPINVNRSVEVNAQKKGYKFIYDGDCNFKSEGLSSISVDTGLEGVMVYVSMGQNTILENVTDSKGHLELEEMAPGKYYIRPFLAEYTFTPEGIQLDVAQITATKVSFSFKKTQYSVKGKISNIVMKPTFNIAIEAICSDVDCSHKQEAVSMQNGNYRIRKLAPNKNYIVRLSSNHSSVAKSIPNERLIHIKESDIEDIDFIILEKPSIFEIAGKLVLPMAKSGFRGRISLYNSSDSRNPMSVVELGESMLYRFEGLSKDKYTIMTTIISGAEYNIQPVQIDLYQENINWTNGDVWVEIKPEVVETKEVNHVWQLLGLLLFPGLILIWINCVKPK